MSVNPTMLNNSPAPQRSTRRATRWAKKKSRILGCASSSVPHVDSNTKKPCVPNEAALLTLPWTLREGLPWVHHLRSCHYGRRGTPYSRGRAGTVQQQPVTEGFQSFHRTCSPEQGPLQGSPQGPGTHLIFQTQIRALLTSSNVLAFGVQQHAPRVFSCPLNLTLWLIQLFLMWNSSWSKQWWWVRRHSEWFNALLHSRWTLNILS